MYSFNRFDIDDAEDLRGTLSIYYGPGAITTAKVFYGKTTRTSYSLQTIAFAGRNSL